ncbi:hypothetical protein [Archangium lipolyticum]|uniref:hypothetical protein n=1 Tax=Archangium lipolyticum TaxID=2970465 RepID=UPI002149A91A|nr:hypothetical protein [Archangium lipolyticum]
MNLNRDTFLSKAETTLAGLDGAVLEALSHHGAPEVESLAQEFGDAASRSPARLAEALCPGPLTNIGFAAVVMRGLLEPRDEVLDSSVSEATVVTGNARASGSLNITSPLVVLGNLEVEGVLEDCGPDSTVVVVGNCVARGLRTSGNFLVLGDLVVRDVIQGIYNDDSLVVAGELSVRFLDEYDHDVSCYGEVHAEHHFENGRSGEEAASLASVFLVPGLYDVDLGEIHHDQLFERLERNEPVFTETPQPRQRREPDGPTAEELEGIDVAGIVARSPVSATARDVVYAQRKTGEVWLLRPGAFRVHIYDGEKFLESQPSPAPEATKASERVTFWRKRSDLFLEIERFDALVQVHAGYNNGTKTTLRFAFDGPDAAAREVRRLAARYEGDFLRVTTTIPGRGPLERELARYGGKSEYTSAIVKGNTLVTRDGESQRFDDEASALRALEDWLAEKRRAGFELKILEWKPYGLLK